MSQSTYKHNYQEFLDFCKASEEHNNELFDDSKLITEADGSIQYTGTYRDKDNYKDPFYVTFNEEAGSISYVAGPEECMDELDAIYLEMFRSNMFPNMDASEVQSASMLAGTQPASPETSSIQDAELLIKIMETVQSNITMILVGSADSSEVLIQSQRLLTQGINLLDGIRPASDAPSDISDTAQQGMETIGDMIGSLATPGERFFVTQGRKILKRADVSGWDSDFDSDESALLALRDNSLIVFEGPFDRGQCAEIEAALQDGEAFIVQRNLTDTFGYNTLIRTSEGSYCLISLGRTF
ncbi:hypothetical protein [Paenibacillus taichungensis]